MKNWWVAQSARINALSLRERVFMFFSVLVCCLAVVDVVWLSPAQMTHKQLKQQFERQTNELKRMRSELRSSAKPVDSMKSVRDEKANVQNRIDEVNQNIRNVLPSKGEGTPLAQVLAQLLRRHEGLTLERTSAMPVEVAFGKSTQTTGTDVPGMPVGLTRQGVELMVSGPYPELIRYVQTLETALPAVRWAGLKVKSEKHTPELTLQLFLIGGQP
jgi:MSHA biogenesis protein MshJ